MIIIVVYAVESVRSSALVPGHVQTAFVDVKSALSGPKIGKWLCLKGEYQFKVIFVSFSAVLYVNEGACAGG